MIIFKYKLVQVILMVFCFSGCFFGIPFNEFNPKESDDLSRLEFDEENTKAWRYVMRRADLSLDDLDGIDESLYKDRRQSHFYALCKFNSRTKSESSLYSSKGEITYFSESVMGFVTIDTLELAEGYCEYRLKKDEDSKYFDQSKKFKKGDVVFIDEVYVLRPIAIIIASPEIKVLKRHFK